MQIEGTRLESSCISSLDIHLMFGGRQQTATLSTRTAQELLKFAFFKFPEARRLSSLSSRRSDASVVTLILHKDDLQFELKDDQDLGELEHGDLVEIIIQQERW